MKQRNALLVASVLGGMALWTAPASAQQEQDQAAMMAAWEAAGRPGKPHQQLAALVGRWQAETKMWMDPAAEPETSTGTIEYSMVMGGRYLEEKVSATFAGQPFTGLGLYGYNNLTGKIEAVWIDDMGTGIYQLGGTINEAGNELNLKGRYFDAVTRAWKETESVMHIVAPDRIHSVSYEIRDGQKVKTMELTATRVASR
jgi:hypothetical protein